MTTCHRTSRIFIRFALAAALGCGAIATTAANAAETTGAVASTDALLLQARIALREGHVLSPAGGSAFELYLRARDSAPEDSRPREALTDLYPMTQLAIEGAINRGDYQEARRMIELVDRAVPNSLTVSNLRSRLERQSPSVASAR